MLPIIMIAANCALFDGRVSKGEKRERDVVREKERIVYAYNIYTKKKNLT